MKLNFRCQCRLFAALTVKYITKRFIMEYDPDIGEQFDVLQHVAMLHHQYSARHSVSLSHSSWNGLCRNDSANYHTVFRSRALVSNALSK